MNTNTITPEQFMAETRIKGAVHTRNGPRLYIDSVPHREFNRNRGAIQQVAFIDLVSYTAHCTTQSPTLSPIQCRDKSRELEQRLAPVARLARIKKVVVPPDQLPCRSTFEFTHKRVLYTLLREAGVMCAMDDRAVVIDMEHLVRRTAGPWNTMRRDYLVRLVNDPAHTQWTLPLASREMVLAALSGNVMLGVRVRVSAMTAEPDDDIIAALHLATNELLAETL